MYDTYDPYNPLEKRIGNPSTINGIGGSSTMDQGSSQMNGNRPRSSHYDTTPTQQNGSNGSPNQQQQQPQSMNQRQVREMSTESSGGGYRSGSSSNRALYASPPTSNTLTNGYESSPSSKYSTTPVQQTPYRYSDYKPIPPPKTSVYKPVPPPKPKSYPRNGGTPQQQPPMMNGMGGPHGAVGATNGMSTQPTSLPIVEGNYMNSGPQLNSGGYATANHGATRSNNLHYQSSQYNGHQNPYGRGSQKTNNYDEDSGQGSSLDRDYGHYNNNNGGYSKGGHMVNGSNSMAPTQGPPPPPPATNHSRGQYYYNMPPQNQNHADPNMAPSQQQQIVNGTSPRRGGDGLDLSNREYRGSAFELYKKPNQNHMNNGNVGNHQQPHYAYANGHHQMAR